MIETQLSRLPRGFTTTSEPHMTYLGDGISTDEDFENDAETDAGTFVPPPPEEEAPESDGAAGNPEEV